jgi:hypothetical protein
MKKLFLFLILFLHFFCIEINAQSRYFEWMNQNSGARERILVETKAHVREIQPNVWQQLGVLNVNAADLTDLPETFSNNYFLDTDGESLLITVSGTGKVYQFNLNKRELKRLDKTYFKGYNFEAPQFIRKDTLYSFGGTGFWGYSKSLTFYDKSQKEWQDLLAINIGPECFVGGYQGYSNQNDMFYSCAPVRNLQLKGYPKVIDDRLFAFNFKTYEWSILGKLNPEIPITDKKAIIWDGKYFLHFNISNVYFLDPIKNEVFLFENHKSFFPNNNNIRLIGDTIQIYPENLTTIIKLSKTKLLHNAKFIGKFYINENQVYYYYSFAAISLSGLIILSYFVYYKKRKRSNSKIENNPNFDSLELTLLKKLIGLELDKEKYVSVLEVNEILRLDDKSPEHQRRLRSKFLKDLNLKFLINYKIKEAIVRFKSSEDSRLVYYKLTNEAKEQLIDLINKTDK